MADYFACCRRNQNDPTRFREGGNLIVIPMVGLSSRFTKAGYNVPKYMLPLGRRSVFNHAVSSFSAYFAEVPFLFIVRDINGTADFVRQECELLGIKQVEVAVLPEMTRGQAETVMEGLSRSGCPLDVPITIFNIDTFRPDFRYPENFEVGAVDGYLEVFEGSGANWSFVRPDGNRPFGVLETAEKREISNLCCTGLYHFRTADRFAKAYAAQTGLSADRLQGGELYVAPLYNELIREECDIRYFLIARGQVIFCGVPAEYEALNSKKSTYREGYGIL